MAWVYLVLAGILEIVWAYAMKVSADGRKMRLTADVWLPTAVGAQIISLLTEHATTDGD